MGRELVQRFWEEFHTLPNKIKVEVTAMLFKHTFGGCSDDLLVSLLGTLFTVSADGFGLRVLVRLVELHELDVRDDEIAQKARFRDDVNIRRRSSGLRQTYKYLAQNKNLPADLVDWLLDRRVPEVAEYRTLSPRQMRRLVARCNPDNEVMVKIMAANTTAPELFGHFLARFMFALGKRVKASSTQDWSVVMSEDRSQAVMKRFAKDLPPVPEWLLRKMHGSLPPMQRWMVLKHPDTPRDILDAEASKPLPKHGDGPTGLHSALMQNPSVRPGFLSMWAAEPRHWVFLANNSSLPQVCAMGMIGTEEPIVLFALACRQHQLSAEDWRIVVERLLEEDPGCLLNAEVEGMRPIAQDPRMTHGLRLHMLDELIKQTLCRTHAHPESRLIQLFFAPGFVDERARRKLDVSDRELCELIDFVLSTGLQGMYAFAMGLLHRVGDWPEEVLWSIYGHFKDKHMQDSAKEEIFRMLAEQKHSLPLREHFVNSPSRKERAALHQQGFLVEK